MTNYLNERWRETLAHNGLADFDAIWNFSAEWFEAPNRRRGGWSGVSRCELTRPDGTRCAVFLKRQENHGTRSLGHPFRGIPTYLREFRHIMNYRKAGIPTLEPVYFGMRKVGKDDRAILMTEELTGFVSLEDRVQHWLKEGAPQRTARLNVLRSVAALLRKMHMQHIQHSCFFPKHIFMCVDAGGSIEVRVIDLEKSRWRFFKTVCAMRDLYSLNLLSSCWSTSDRMWFFREYLQIPRLTPYAKWLWHRIAERTRRKKSLLREAGSVRCQGGCQPLTAETVRRQRIPLLSRQEPAFWRSRPQHAGLRLVR